VDVNGVIATVAVYAYHTSVVIARKSISDCSISPTRRMSA